MAERVRGVVFRAGKSKFGFYIKLDGDDTFYNTKYEPKVGEGDEVGIEFDRKGRSCNIKAVKVFSKGSGGGNGAGRSGNGSGGYQPAGGDRQDSIVWQSSRKDAIEMAKVLAQTGAITLPKAANDRATIMAGLVDTLTYRYFVDASNPRESKTFKSEAGVESDGAEPDSWDEQPSPTEDAPWGEPEGAADEVQWD